jgi:hypothetical protein
VEAIFKLARTEDVGTRKRCATALCNLSFEPGVRRKMVRGSSTSVFKGRGDISETASV